MRLVNKKIITEVDGKQQFEKVSKWKCPSIFQQRDKFKEECANKTVIISFVFIKKTLYIFVIRTNMIFMNTIVCLLCEVLLFCSLFSRIFNCCRWKTAI